MSCSCLPRKNHVRLIENCYPTQAGQNSPQPSETSYLVYYAASKPAKLAKVAQYLKKRISRDVYRQKKFDIMITIGIINELMAGCSKDLNLFAKCVLYSLSTILEMGDFDLSWAAANTFRRFCTLHDGSTLGVDENLTREFDSLTSSFIKEASKDTSKESEKKWRLLGLRAIHGLVSSTIIKSSSPKAYLKELIYSILSNIDSFKAYLTESDLPETPECLEEHYTLSPTEMSEATTNVCSLECGKQLLQNSPPLYLREITVIFFSYIEEHNHYQCQDYCIDLVHFIMLNVAPSYRHIIVNEIRKMLKLCNEMEVDQRKATLINLIAFCLANRMVAVGLSVLEVVEALIDHLFIMLKYKSLNKNNTHPHEFTPLEAEFRKGIVESIGGLATHLYYSEQINDILDFLIKKLSLNCKEQVVDEVPVSSIRRAVLKCMKILVDTNSKAVEDSHYGNSEVPYSIISPTFCLFTNEHPSVRKEYGFFFLSYLDNWSIHESKNTATPKSSTINSAKHVHRSVDTALEFRHALHQALFDCTLQESLFPLDYSIILSIFKKLLQRYQHDELIRVTPLMFKLQGTANSIEQPHALDQFVASYFEYAGEFLEIEQLRTYMKEVIKTRKQSNCWFDPRDCNLNDLKCMEGKTFAMLKENNNLSYQARRVNIDPDTIKEILLHDEHSQRQFSDLEKRLDLEYDPKGSSYDSLRSSICSQQCASGAHVHHLKLSAPLIVRHEDSEPPVSPKVENLLEALKNGNDSSDFMDSDSSDVPREMSLTSRTIRSDRSKADIKNLLRSVSVRATVPSSISLVNTPHLHH
ncbi:hypothetical protein K493DRAFT_339962 [Basidiobolus meristosporus CBS 931.73]|uniref:Protein EFR3 n=1 Tax=Basidiobolus meristosporus CBS 931.73 TaxID=1314790 RepID=A0A1Y1XXL0_9FUNG|nr:hypothetical protein K493DRAFT_339962 [Basidiobolus meristosporus CBS 931.73]|eukprot:ORX90493.1 hypothetical protein K493DRAFT_339962 [Basidiobolus meristosporus CBS 931.73]